MSNLRDKWDEFWLGFIAGAWLFIMYAILKLVNQ